MPNNVHNKYQNKSPDYVFEEVLFVFTVLFRVNQIYRQIAKK